MNPYELPKSELGRTAQPSPKIIKIVVGVLFTGAMLSVANSYVLSVINDSKPWDPFIIAMNALWVALILWFCNDILAARSNPKFILIGLALWVLYVGFDELNNFYTSF